MSRECTLVIKDQVNIRFEGLDVVTRRKLVDSVKYFLPYARHTPAFKLGRWDGMVRFCDIGARSYFHLLDKLLPIVISAGYAININDNRDECSFDFEPVTEDTYSHVTWPKGHTCEGQPIVLRDYQIEYINTFLNEVQGVSVAPTGAGKTLCTAALSEKIGQYGRSIIIVPSKDLVLQTEEDFLNLGLDVGVYYGDRKEYHKTHTICTWQSLEVLNKKSKHYDPDFSLSDFLDGVKGVIVDEVHKSKADVLKKLLSGPFSDVPIRWGLTGTIPKEEHAVTGIKAVIGPVLGQMTAKELQDKGILANLHINIWQLQDHASVFNSYPDELKWLTTNKERINFLSEKIIHETQNGNTLVLVDRISTGEMLEELIPDSVFVNGKMKSDDRKSEYKEVQYADKKTIIATYGVASTGINLPRIFNLFLFESGKSFVRVIQSIGRGIRKAEDKDYVNVFDVCSNCKYSKKHLTVRKKYYKEAEYPFSIEKIAY